MAIETSYVYPSGPPNFKRLLKLAEHLEKGTLGHKKFDFAVYNGNSNRFEYSTYEGIRRTCGTNGCAIGECPIAFKNQWKFSDVGTPVLRGSESNWPDDSARPFFSITHDEYKHLFYPEGQDPDRFGGKGLLPNATRKQVAANIRAFVALFKSDPWR